MQVIKLTDNKYVLVDDNDQSRVVVKSELEKQVTEAEERLKAIPQLPSDEELLAWAKENYPMIDYSRERQSLEDIVSRNTKLLSELK